MKTKKCTKCGKVQPVEQFNHCRTIEGGYTRHCKSCYRAYYLANKGDYRARGKQYRLSHPDYARPTKASPEAMKAHRATAKAKRNGQLKCPVACLACGAINVPLVAHHDDYGKPLDVIWLCGPCHWKKHHGTVADKGELEASIKTA